MKKLFVLILTVVSVTVCGVCLSACQKKTKTTAAQVCETLTELVKKDYSSVKLEVSVSNQADTLKGTYTATKSEQAINLNYTYQVLNTFDKVNGEYVVPEEKVSTKTGSVKVQNGSVVEQTGDSLDLSISTLTVENFSFKQDNLTVKNQSDGVIKAEVKDISKYFGYAIEGSSFTTEVRYTQSTITQIKLNYTNPNGNAVEYVYSLSVG